MSEAIRKYYDSTVEREWRRLDQPLGRVEFESTLRLIRSYFPGSGRVVDVGSGPGRYALELTRRGYRVSLVEPAHGLLERARFEFGSAGLSAEAFVGSDAVDLTAFAADSFDAALFLGPLYHLADAQGRSQALTELRRVLRPGGVAIAAYLNSWGLLRTGLTDFPSWFRDLAGVQSLLHAKAYSEQELSGFTEAYWSTPPDALREVVAGGFDVVSYAGAEGFCGGLGPTLAGLAEREPAVYQCVVTFAAATCELPQYRDATDHLHVVLRKP